MTSTVFCDYQPANWEINSVGQDACQVYAQLQANCDIAFVIRGINADPIIISPEDTVCGCNMVAYNLAAGCRYCQSSQAVGSWLSINEWASHCTANRYEPRALGDRITTRGMTFPEWAFAIPSGTTWDPAQASAVAAAASPITSSSSSSSSPVRTPTPAAAPNVENHSSSSNIDNKNALIIGMAVFLAVALMIIVMVSAVLLHCRRQNRRTAWSRPTAAYFME